MGTMGCCSGFGFGSLLALASWFPRIVCCLCTVSSPAKKEIRKKDFPAPHLQDHIRPCPRIHALFFSCSFLSMLIHALQCFISPTKNKQKQRKRDLLAHLLDKSVSLQSWIHWHLVLGQLLLVYDPRRCLFVGVNNIAVFVGVLLLWCVSCGGGGG